MQLKKKKKKCKKVKKDLLKTTLSGKDWFYVVWCFP